MACPERRLTWNALVDSIKAREKTMRERLAGEILDKERRGARSKRRIRQYGRSEQSVRTFSLVGFFEYKA